MYGKKYAVCAVNKIEEVRGTSLIPYGETWCLRQWTSSLSLSIRDRVWRVIWRTWKKIKQNKTKKTNLSARESTVLREPQEQNLDRPVADVLLFIDTPNRPSLLTDGSNIWPKDNAWSELFYIYFRLIPLVCGLF